MKDPWKILGLAKGSSADDVARAWRKKAFQFHPDLGGDVEAFKEALWAYEILSMRNFAENGERDSDPMQPSYESDAFQGYARAYYDAWHDVPSDIRFWVGFFETIHTATMFVAHPFFFGGALILIGGFLNNRESQTVTGLAITVVSALSLFLAYSHYWDNLRIDLKDKYCRRMAQERTVTTYQTPPQSSSFSSTNSSPSIPDEKGGAAGCAFVCVALMLGAFLMPRQDADDLGGLIVFLVILGVPLVWSLSVLFGKRGRKED